MTYRPMFNLGIGTPEGKTKNLKSFRILNRISALTLLLRIIAMKDNVARLKFILETNPDKPNYGLLKRINATVTEDFDIEAFSTMKVNIPEVLIYEDLKALHDISLDHRIIRRIKTSFVETMDNPMKIRHLKIGA